MHSRKKGKSGSKKPMAKSAPAWVDAQPKDVEELVIQFSKQGIKPATIGLILRDRHGVPSVKQLCGKTVSKILAENKLAAEFPEDLMNLIRRAVRVRRHMQKNKSDTHNRVKLGHVESKIRRLVRYYWNEGIIPRTWAYDPAKAELLVK